MSKKQHMATSPCHDLLLECSANLHKFDCLRLRKVGLQGEQGTLNHPPALQSQLILDQLHLVQDGRNCSCYFLVAVAVQHAFQGTLLSIGHSTNKVWWWRWYHCHNQLEGLGHLETQPGMAQRWVWGRLGQGLGQSTRHGLGFGCPGSGSWRDNRCCTAARRNNRSCTAARRNNRSCRHQSHHRLGDCKGVATGRCLGLKCCSGPIAIQTLSSIMFDKWLGLQVCRKITETSLNLDIWRSSLLWDEKSFWRCFFLLSGAVGQLAFVISTIVSLPRVARRQPAGASVLQKSLHIFQVFMDWHSLNNIARLATLQT